MKLFLHIQSISFTSISSAFSKKHLQGVLCPGPKPWTRLFCPDTAVEAKSLRSRWIWILLGSCYAYVKSHALLCRHGICLSGIVRPLPINGVGRFFISC